MKTLLEIKDAIKELAADRTPERGKRVVAQRHDIQEIEMRCASDPGFMSFYEVHELKRLIGKFQSKRGA